MNPDVQNELFRTLGRIESKLDDHAGRLDRHTKIDEELAVKVENRLRALERLKWTVTGAVSLVVFLAEFLRGMHR